MSAERPVCVVSGEFRLDARGGFTERFAPTDPSGFKFALPPRNGFGFQSDRAKRPAQDVFPNRPQNRNWQPHKHDATGRNESDPPNKGHSTGENRIRRTLIECLRATVAKTVRPRYFSDQTPDSTSSENLEEDTDSNGSSTSSCTVLSPSSSLPPTVVSPSHFYSLVDISNPLPGPIPKGFREIPGPPKSSGPWVALDVRQLKPSLHLCNICFARHHLHAW